MHHLTISYRPNLDEIKTTPFGKKIVLYVVGLAEDERAQVLQVANSQEFIYNNSLPCIIVATDGDTPPEYGKNLLKLKALHLSESIPIPATIGWWNGTVPVFSAP
jgi:hypothetical protein